MKRSWTAGVLFTLSALQLAVNGQTVDWFTGGNTGLNPATSFLGTTDGVPINFRTDNLLRAKLNHTTSYTIGSFVNQNANGYLGLSPNGTLWANGPGPFSRLHLHDGSSSPLEQVYRPWMDNGITFTTNNDQMYIGHKVEEGDDQTSAVIQWADNDAAPAGPDVLKFLFAAGYSGGNYNVSGLHGREIARMHPAGYFGVGDWQLQGLQPTERVDLLNGRLRIRQLPTSAPMDTLNRFMVVDQTGVVHWRNIPPGTLGCEWNQYSATNHLRTAWAGAPGGCPGEPSRVGIGIGTTPGGKLHVLATPGSGLGTALLVDQQRTAGTAYGVDVLNNWGTSEFNSGSAFGVRTRVGSAYRVDGVFSEVVIGHGEAVDFANGVRAEVTSSVDVGDLTGVSANVSASSAIGLLRGLRAYVTLNGSAIQSTRGVDVKIQGTGTSGVVWGGRFESINAQTTCYGVEAKAAGGSPTLSYGVKAESTAGTTRNYGLHGYAQRNGTVTNYGIYAQALGSGGATNWAGWFQGNVNVTGLGYIPGGTWLPSDETLKTDLQDVEDAVGILGQLKPMTYTYVSDLHPNAGLPAGTHCGLMAQDLQEILPQLVQDISIPALLDTLGVELAPAETIKAINYMGLVPYLIAAFNEQQKRLDQLEESLAACCAADTDKTYQPGPLDGQGEVKQDPALERWLRIDPNPFTDATTVRYTLERAGRAQLLVNSGDGKQLQMLHESLSSAGDHHYDWHTAQLAPGVYYVTLLLDGEPLVKRAVKVR